MFLFFIGFVFSILFLIIGFLSGVSLIIFGMTSRIARTTGLDYMFVSEFFNEAIYGDKLTLEDTIALQEIIKHYNK